VKDDILKLVDSHGKPIEKFDFVDPENPKILIDPEIGKTYEAVFHIFNSSEWKVINLKLSHNYSDIRIFPEIIDSLKPHKISKPISIIWRPFTTQGIESKIKDHKITLNIQPSCTVEIEQEVKQ
jgi:hypothetical protein